MSEKLYTRVSEEFEKNGLAGHVLIAGPDLSDTHGFTELGYDTPDYDAPPIVYEVTPKATRYATREDLERLAEAAGVKMWLTKEEYLKCVHDADENEWKERDWPEDDVEPNQLLARPEVRAALEAEGFDAYRDFIVVSNTQPEVHIFWKEGTFELSGPVELEPAEDADGPYDVRIADGAQRPAI